jgi:hypothetical protein
LFTCIHRYGIYGLELSNIWVPVDLVITQSLHQATSLSRFRLLALKFSLEEVHFHTKLQGRIFSLLDISISISLNTLNTIKNTLYFNVLHFFIIAENNKIGVINWRLLKSGTIYYLSVKGKAIKEMLRL